MKKTTIKMTLVFGLIFVIALTSGCSAIVKPLDVIGNQSTDAFALLLSALPDQLEADEEQKAFSLWAADSTARLIWHWDWSETSYDAVLEVDAAPFLNAGLDPAKLPSDYRYEDGKIIVGIELGQEALEYEGAPTPQAAYAHIVDLRRDLIGYHMAMDHFGVGLGNGNMFEWAKDLAGNDKDMVFVLEPAPFLSAGVQPESVEGWAFAKVDTEVDGKHVSVDKFLKVFDVE